MPKCSHMLVSADNEYAICLKDCNECRQDCNNHFPKLDDDIKQFMDELNKRL